MDIIDPRRVAVWRELRGLTQHDLAEKTGLSRSLIAMIETAKQPFTDETRAKIAEALSIRREDRLSHPEMDEDGYPTDETLETITDWPWEEWREWLAFCRAGWKWESYWSDDPGIKGIYHVSTGGWSGNESIIYAMRANPMLRSMCFLAERRGGHYLLKDAQDGPDVRVDFTVELRTS